MQQLIRTVVRAGLKEPVRILHLTDVHLSFADEQDPPEYGPVAESRFRGFYEEGGRPPKTPSEYFEEALRTAEETGALAVCTGDAMDLLTHGNAAEFHRIVGDRDMLFTPGGHEHQKQFVRTMEEEDGYWLRARRRLAELLPRYPLDFDHRIVGGLNVVAVDNSLDYFNAVTLARFREELDRGLPMIVFAHDSIEDPYLNARRKTHPNVPLTKQDYAVSHEMIDLIQTSPLVKAFVAGHEHIGQEGKLRSGNPWYVTPGLFKGVCRLLEVR